VISPGSKLGPYEILAPVGAGGMGEVYKAKDTRLERTVAIKVLPAHLSSSPEMRRRFEREAKTISALSHPHICALFDVGNQEGVEYLVMELLEGETLADRLARGPLPPDQTLRYGIEIADALDKAHRRGIVHRDLKPGNVMLTGSGVKVLDFGLARVVEPIASKSELSVLPTAAPSRPLTQEGTILGTLQYMAPEQLEGKEADARTDIFAFGAVLYEMATGQRAFSGSSRASLISAILRDEPQPISRVQPMSPPALDRVVRRCLAKDPEKRWQSARDVGLEIEEAAKPPEASAAVPLRTFTRIAAVSGWAIAVLLLILLAGNWLALGRAKRAAPERALRFTIPPPSGAAFEGMLALSPDGRTLAFVATAADGRDLLFLRPLDALESRALPGTEGAAYPFWSPDGHAIAFFAQGKLKRIDALGGAPQTLSDALGPRGGSWSSHGTIVFSAESGGQVRFVSESGGESHPVGSLASRRGETYRWPSFLPDGRHFLYFTFAGKQPKTGVAVASLDSNETAFLVAADSGGVYAPPGFLLYRRGDSLVAQSFDPGRLHISGDAVPIVDDVWWDGISTLATAFTVSPGGLLAYQTGGLNQSRLLLYDRAGREIRKIDLSGAYFEPALSPDGRRVAVARAQARGSAIWMVDIERGAFSQFSFETELSDASPLWTPDGRNVLYSVYPGAEVYQRDAAGAEKEKLLFRFPAFSPLDDLSRDGRYLLYESVNWPTFHFDVFLRDLRDGSDRPLLKDVFNQEGARFSPDGRWLAYESEESGVREVFVRSYPGPGERRQVSAGGGTQPRWRSDGKELFYVSPDRKVMAVDIQMHPSLDSGMPHALFQTRILPTVEARNHYDASGDGQRFIVNSRRPEDATLPITVVVGWAPALRK
jgi:eukaryotic-like serine/threonine-protein kinase